jgi:hypothetical protein
LFQSVGAFRLGPIGVDDPDFVLGLFQGSVNGIRVGFGAGEDDDTFVVQIFEEGEEEVEFLVGSHRV